MHWNWKRSVEMMVFETNALGVLQGQWYIWHIFQGRERKSTLAKPGRDRKFPQNLHPMNLQSTTGQIFVNIIVKIVERHIQVGDLLNASQFSLPARHSTTLLCMSLTNHVALNFNSNMSTAEVFLDIEKDVDTTWRLVFCTSYINQNFRQYN
jgi:hypothetical protein